MAGGSRLTARYSFSDRRLFDPFAGPGFALIPGFGTDVPRRGQNLAVTFTQTPASRLVNDLRFGYNRVAIGVFAETRREQLVRRSADAGDQSPRRGLSVISIAGYSPLGHETRHRRKALRHGPGVRHRHIFERPPPGEGRRRVVRHQAVGVPDVQSRGFLTFINQGYTGNALADLLLGLPVLTGGARLDNPQNLRARSWSVFAQDDWRPVPSLTISAGLRYDYAAPPVDADDRANLYDKATGRIVEVGSGDMPRGGYDPDRNNVAPRAGFAWSVNRERTNVIRGGYGIYYNQGALATSEGLFFNPPYFNLSVFSRRRIRRHPRGPISRIVPCLYPAVRHRLPAGFADAVDGTLEPESAAPDRPLALV